jgi:plastocyanin
MAQTTTPTSGNQPIEVPDGAGDRVPGPAHRLVIGASIIAVVADLVLMTIIGEVIPPLAVIAVLVVGAAVLTRRRPRLGIGVLAALALLALGGSIPFLAGDLTSPADPIAFVYAVLSGGGRILALVGAVLAWRSRHDAVRVLVIGSLGVLVVAVAGSLTARAVVESEDRVAGDVPVVAEGFEYPERVEVASGGTLHLRNRDIVRHDFAVEGTDIHVDLEPRVGRRVVVDLPVGTYEFVCTIPGHEHMTGTLEVTP